ncbi:MAG: DUF1559 domain-containing protein [Candidatus Hydrogenedentes bacterium]|nr:DUF1559 domain-containing protein [Candidatus Hydrogenedentota bacterium]
MDDVDAKDPQILGTKLAVISLFCALLLPVFPPFPSIAAIIIGHIARIRISEFSRAKIGSIVSVIALFFGYSGIVVYLLTPADGPLMPWGRSEAARRASCQHNLQQIKYACMAYSSNHGGILPEKFNDLSPEFITEPAVFLCPSSKASMGDTSAIDSWTSYEFISNVSGENVDHFVTVREKDRHAHTLGRNYLYPDGRIAFVRERDEK